MQLQELNSGIVYTNSSCIGCNKCISGCLAVGANVVVKDIHKERHTVQVDPNKCIICGRCIQGCVHDARTYKDDTDEFFQALERGESISVLVSPSLLISYEKQYNHILGYLKHLGANHIYNVSFGADLMVWACMNFYNKFGVSGMISQICPVIVTYLEKYKPELLPYLMPVQSPVMCTAIYVNDYLKNKDKLAYITPCIASKHEIRDVNTYDMVHYNVTFERFMERLAKVDMTPYYAEDETEYGLGSLTSMLGGVSDNVELYIGFDRVLLQVSGSENLGPYFNHYSKALAAHDEVPFLVDVLNCVHGCNQGTGSASGVELRNEMAFAAHRSKERAYESGNVPKAFGHDERVSRMNERFREFELSSFVRQYGLTRKISATRLDPSIYEQVFLSMYKDTPEKRRVDCGACGYKTCKAMAYAIGCQVNHKENCISYSKECIKTETEKTQRLLGEISNINEELKKSDQLKSNFLANMSHEIRTPMNAVIGMAEMALRGDLKDEERGYIQQIKESGRSLLAIINDILDFTKIESGKMEINETKYRVMSIINDTVNTMMTRTGEKNITLIIDVDAAIPAVLYGDDIRIKQVLVNIANNAVKFTKSGSITISMHCERTDFGIDLIIAVKDTGIGIKQEDLDKLFTSFQQLDSKRNRNVEGTGLGLVISREFVHLMNGEMWVESTYGKGSTFFFRVPQKIVEDTPSISLNLEKPVKTVIYSINEYILEGFVRTVSQFSIENTVCRSLKDLQAAISQEVDFIFINYPLWDAKVQSLVQPLKDTQIVVITDPRKDIVISNEVRKISQPVYCQQIAALLEHEEVGSFKHEARANLVSFEAPDAKILIIDDSEINLTVANGLLSPFRMNISLAMSAAEGIKLLKKNRYDIIFMDHMMPEIDGVEATHMIREMKGDYYKELPIIALSANAIKEAQKLFLSSGMNDFVAKPIDMVDIASKIKKWLPPHKIKPVGQKETVEEEQSVKMQIPGLDVEIGLSYAGTTELYQKILTDFYHAIKRKSDLIEGYEKEGEIKSYTIEVHALKSASRLIGAMELSEKAEYLEKCGHEEKEDIIHSETPGLLLQYRKMSELLEPYIIREKKREEMDVGEAVLKDLLEGLRESLENFDLDQANQQFEALSGIKVKDEVRPLREELAQAIEKMEYDEGNELVEQWLKKI